jgi:hypothetical protein
MDILSKKDNRDEMSEEQIKQDAKNKALESLKNQKATIINIDEIADAEARKAADAYMTEDKGNSNIFKRFWKHTFMEGYYRNREINRVKEEIKNTGNIYTGRIKDNNKIAHENAMQAITERFTSEYEGTLSDDEEKKNLDDKDPESLKAKNDIKNLITEYAKGSLSEQAFKEEKTRILNTLNKDNFKGKSNYADNLFEIAKNARIAIEHGAKMDELELDTNIIIGKAKSSLRTEAHFNNVDKIVDKLKQTKIGQFISPAALSTSVGIAYSLSVGLGAKILRSKAAAIGTFGAAVGISSALAGINESQRLTAERAQHAIEMAEGGEFEEGSKRRELMEKYQYKMESSKDLSSNLRDLMYEKDKDGNEVLKDIKEEDLEKIFAGIANIDARKSLNKEKKIDLISYSSIGNVEKESTDLIILVAKAKKVLREKIENDFKKGIPNGNSFDTFDSYLAKNTEVLQNSLLRGQGQEKGIDALDKEFKKFKTKEVAKKVVKTAVFGLVIGATVQEGVAFFKDDVQGMFEGMLGHTNGNAITQTPLSHLHDWMTGHSSHIGMGNAIETDLNGHNFRLPEGTSIIENSDGTFDILRGDQVISDNIPLNFDADGNLDADSLARLGEDGIIGNTIHTVIDSTEEVKGTAEDYINNHQGETHQVHRLGWWDNNTPKPIFDHNELRLEWGGESGSEGIDANGNYVLDVGHMTSGGSFHDNLSMDAQEEIKKGGLKIMFSLTQGTQNHVFEVPVDANGNAVIDPNSEIGKLFFSEENGHAVFKGRFAEVVQSFGEKDGVEQIKSLATLEGPGNDSITDIISTHIDNPVTNLDLPIDTEPPMFLPFMTRRPLEKLKIKDMSELVYYMNYNGTASTEDEEKYFKSVRSKTLKENPNAKLDHYKEIEDYFNKFDKGYFERIHNLSNQIGPMDKECKLSVNIPVAGHQESNSIYESLKNYTYQTAKTNEFELVLFVNHPETDKNGNKLNAEDVLSEIERFKNDYPDIKTNVIYEVLTNKEANIGLIRKLMNDSTLLRHHERGNTVEDLIMVSNDADNKGLDPRYIDTFIDEFHNNPDVDGLLGQLDWDPESYQKFPDIHIGTRLFQYLNVIGRHNTKAMTSSGANSAFKSSIYAAIGGYRNDISGGEDAAIRKAIVSARGNNERFAFAGLKTRLFTSSRRAIVMWKQFGLPPVDQWRRGFSVQGDDEIRKLIMEDSSKINYDSKDVLDKLKISLEDVINKTIDVYEGGEKLGKNSRYYKKALGWLGVTYKLDKNKNIIITDMTSLVEGLKKYQIQGKLIRDARSGKVESINELKSLRDKDKENESLKNKNKETSNIIVGEMEKLVENFIDELPDNKQKIDSLIKILNKSLNNEILKKIDSNITLKEIKSKLENSKKLKTGAEFINEVKDILNPLFIGMSNNNGEFASFKRRVFNESHNFIPLNEVFSYSLDEKDLHLHMSPSDDISAVSKVRYIKDGLEKLSEIIKSNKKIEKISATSWIVAKNPKLLERLGFKNEGPIDEKTRKRDFSGETNPISRATISREEFLSKYLKTDDKIGFFKKISRFFSKKSNK